MDNLFMLLLLISIVGLIVGVAKPSAVSKFLRGEPTRKKAAITFASATIAFFVLFGMTTDTSSTPSSKPTSATAVVAEASSAPIVTSTPVPSASVETVTPISSPSPSPLSPLDSLWIAVDKGLSSREGVDIKYSDQTKIANLTITKKSDSFLNEKSVIQSAYASFVKWGLEASNIQGVETLDVTLVTDFNDQYGKSSNDRAVEIMMQTEDFKKFDWSGLKGQSISKQLGSGITNSLGMLYVHPALQSQLENAKLIY